MGRVWHSLIPPKKVQEVMNMYSGVWMPQMDRYWESDDGYNVMSRKIRTAWGHVEHVTISRMCQGDIPWAVKQEIKEELWGKKCTAIEVFPDRRNLVDVCDVYHLWILPRDFKLPFGIHPVRDPLCEPVERGYSFDLDKCVEWTNSPERAALMENKALNINTDFILEELMGDGE